MIPWKTCVKNCSGLSLPSHFYLLTTQACCMFWKTNFSLQLQHTIYMQVTLESACFIYFIRSLRRLESMGRGIPFQLFEWRLPSEFQSSFYNEPANLHLFCTSFPSICKFLLVTHSVELPKQRFFSFIEDHIQIIPPLRWNISESNGHPGMG